MVIGDIVLIENSLVRKQIFNDGLFLKRLYKVTTKEEVDYIINILDKDIFEYADHKEVKEFFIKIRYQYDSWYDTILGITEHFDINTERLYKNHFITLQLKIEQGLIEEKKNPWDKKDNPSPRLAKKRANALAWYHRNKHKRKKAQTK